MDRGQFSQLDYILFVIVFVVSAAIGLYYAIKFRNKVTTAEDYLLGGRHMGLFPVSCSLIATSFSASTIIGVAAEANAYGSYMWIFSWGVIIMGIILSWIFLPIFAELKLTSVFKYFELRFNRRVRQLASVLYLFTGLIFLSFTVYVPALTFQQVTGLDTLVTVIVVSVICAVYTAIGGFRAVIWTDVVQLIFMFGSLITIIVVGIYSANGFDNVIEAANRGGRVVITNFKDFNTRSSTWIHLFATIPTCIYQLGLNQTNIQRYMSFSNLTKMKISVWILVGAFSIFLLLTPLLGIILYANYETCDPFTAGLVKRPDHILPYFIQDKASLFLGFNGIFIAGVFSAGLSTSSSYLNAMSGIIYEDFISQIYPRIRRNLAGRIMKITVLILGIIQIGLFFFIQKMGTVAMIAAQCMSLNTCAMITLFALGVFIPKANSKGAQAGALAALICILTLIIGSMNVKQEPTLPFRTDGCDQMSLVLNATLNVLSEDDDDDSWIFKINFYYYGIIGPLIGVVVGWVVSIITGGNAVDDQRLIAKFLRKEHIIKEEEINLKSFIN